MYEACFYNRKTGELLRVHSPSAHPQGSEWARITHEMADIIELAIKFAAR